MSGPVLRGRGGRQRRVGERVEAEVNARRLARAGGGAHEERDFDVAEVDAEVEDARVPARPPARATRPMAATTTPAPGVPSPGRRVPDLSALPPLLHASGAFEALRQRLGPPAAPPSTGRHAGVTSVPHGAKTYLAAALALGADGERLCWIARDAEIGDRVAEELAAWLGDPALVAVLEPRTALAYERSELVPDETAARVAALAAWRSGRARVLVASVQALLQHTIDSADLPEHPWLIRPGVRIAPRRVGRRSGGSALRSSVRWPGTACPCRRGWGEADRSAAV